MTLDLHSGRTFTHGLASNPIIAERVCLHDARTPAHIGPHRQGSRILIPLMEAREMRIGDFLIPVLPKDAKRPHISRCALCKVGD